MKSLIYYYKSLGMGVSMSKIIRGFFCAFIIGWLLCVQKVSASEADELVEGGELQEFKETLYATSAVLMDADSGRVLYGKNEDEPMAMASTTKIMTCILILEEVKLEDTVQVSAYAASMPKVKLYIKKGESYQVKDLLYSLMLESHNDSAVALAEYLGSRYLPGEAKEKVISEHTTEESKQAVAAFAALMNQKAKEIGCENSYFITPNGLDATETITGAGESVSQEHHTTAQDLAKVMSYCIVQSEKKMIFWKSQEREVMASRQMAEAFPVIITMHFYP